MSVQPDDLGFRVFLRERKAPHVGGLPNVFFLSSFSWRLADGFSMSTKIIGSKNRLRRMREMQIFAKQPTSPICGVLRLGTYSQIIHQLSACP